MTDLKFVIRQLLKNPGFVAVSLVSLALGIGLNAAVFSIINAVFFQTIQGVTAPDRIVEGADRVAYPVYKVLRDECHSISGLAASARAAVTVVSRNGPVRHAVPAVSENYFAVLGVRPFLGQFFEGGADGTPVASPEAVLDFEFWRHHLEGDPGVIGQRLSLNGVPFTVIGIAPKAFHGPGPERPPCWVPIGMLPRLEGSLPNWNEVTNRNVEIIGRLDPGSRLDHAEAEAELILSRHSGLMHEKGPVFGTGYEDWHRDPSAEKHAEFLLVTCVPLIVTAVMLWIACSNVANLLLARAVARRREIAVRVATGASRWQIMRLLLLESLVLALGGGLLGLLVSNWTIQFVLATFPEFNALSISVDGHVLAYTAGVSVLSILTFGLVPAIQASRTDVVSGLGSTAAGGTSGLHGSKLRTFFLITQIAGSMALLAVTATFIRSLVVSRFGQPGAVLNHLVVAHLPKLAANLPAAERQRELREQLGSIPGVTSVTLMESLQGKLTRLYLPGTEDLTNAPSVMVQQVDAGFFPTTGNRLLQGHNVNPADKTSVDHEVIINQAAASKFWPGTNALGQRLSLDSTSGFLVAGVVQDQSQQPQVYRALAASVPPATALIRTTPDAAELIIPVRQLLQGMASPSSFPVVSTLRDTQVGELSQITQVSALVGGLALLLAATGLYGAMSFSSNQRMREMGIRLALGATKACVVRTLVASGARIAAIGCAAGLVVVLIAFRLMTGLIFGKWTLDLTSLAAVAVVYGLVTLLACWLPARRAAKVDPIETLRTE